MSSVDRERINDLEDRVVELEKQTRWLRIGLFVLAGMVALLLVPPIADLIGGVIGTLLLIGAVVMGVIVWIGFVIWMLDRLNARRKRS